MREELAVNGGPKTINYNFKFYNPIGQEEMTAALQVLESGVLSGYVGSWEPAFYGGPKVQEFEKDWAKYFGVNHAIAVNSWTSGLICAIGAIGIEPGDEVIVSPWTMSATATAILHWNAIPVFADISPSDFCIDPNEVRKKISPQTKAILAVDIFGQSSNVEALLQIASEHDLKLILDTAQAPGSMRHNLFTGTKGHIGGFSLNHHKHIHTGEGGVVVTNDSVLAERVRMIRNHAEAVLPGRADMDPRNMIGFNFRLGEIEAAIGIQQLRKLSNLVSRRQTIANMLTQGLSKLKGLEIPKVSLGNTHVYYMFPIVLNLEELNTTREALFNQLVAEGVQGLSEGYTNLHALPLFQNKIAYGSSHLPWSLNSNSNYDYSIGTLPIAEKFHSENLLLIELCQFEFSDNDIKLTIEAFTKVIANLE
jgi:perosamine synthetase